jgi:hypothetical protein
MARLALSQLKANRRAFTLTEFALIGGVVAVGILGLFGVFDDSTPLPSIILF